MPRCGLPVRRAVSRRARADETNLVLSVDRKHLGTSTIGPHPARSVPAVAPHDPPRQTDACRSAIGRPIPHWPTYPCRGTDFGYAVVDLHDDGTVESRYVPYGWTART